jgi:hypothetical protein
MSNRRIFLWPPAFSFARAAPAPFVARSYTQISTGRYESDVLHVMITSCITDGEQA